MLKRTVKDKIFAAEQQIQQSSKIWLTRERNSFRDQQERSLEPESYDYFVDEIDRKLESLQGEGLRDLLVYVFKEKEDWSWQKIGDHVYRTVEGKAARKSHARRAWNRANEWLETDHPDSHLADMMRRAGLL
jgi:hypothetical protein